MLTWPARVRAPWWSLSTGCSVSGGASTKSAADQCEHCLSIETASRPLNRAGRSGPVASRTVRTLGRRGGSHRSSSGEALLPSPLWGRGDADCWVTRRKKTALTPRRPPSMGDANAGTLTVPQPVMPSSSPSRGTEQFSERAVSAASRWGKRAQETRAPRPPTACPRAAVAD